MLDFHHKVSVLSPRHLPQLKYLYNRAIPPQRRIVMHEIILQ